MFNQGNLNANNTNPIQTPITDATTTGGTTQLK